MVSPGLLLEGRYRLDHRIASGGMGEVWRATDLVLGRGVAVKLLLPEYSRDPESAARFRTEARHAGMVSHPNIAQVFDYSDGGADSDADGAEAGRPYLVMELVDGPSLAELLKDGPVGPDYALGVTAQVSAGLAAAHAADLVHRDIKPGNLLISKDGLVKITDFGIAHAAGAAPVTRTGEVIGTVAYLAPERASGAPAGPSADLYALGMVAYECLTGRRPFTGDPLAVIMAHQEQPLPPLPPEVPEAVSALVADLTAKDPAARPSNAADVAARAEQLRADLGDTTPPRAGLPVLAGAILNTGPQATRRAAGAAAPLPGLDAAEQEELTRPVAGLAASGGDGGPGSGEPEPEAGPGGPFGWIGRRERIGLAAGVIVLAGLAAWLVLGLQGHTTHARMSDRTHPAARPSTHSPTSSAPTDPGSAPAVAPVTQPASQAPAPAPSATPTQTQTPTQSQTPTPAPTTPAPAPSPSPTKPSTGAGNSGPSGP